MSGILSQWARDETWEWNGSHWVARPGTTTPEERVATGLAFDSRRGVSVMFGGLGGHATANQRALDDTWEWDGVQWMQHTPASSPPSRREHPTAYDEARGTTVIFGGLTGHVRSPVELADTWTWDGSQWRQHTGVGPAARASAAMVYDAGRRQVLLFGGSSGFGPSSAFLGDTWAWNGTAWTQLTPPSSPPARAGAKMAYDRRRGRVVLFGGFGDQAVTDDTWEWDGATWTQASPTTHPSARWDHAMTFDSARGRTLLFGGIDGIDSVGDTWEWDGTTWTLVHDNATPPLQDHHALAYDSGRDRVVSFGGLQSILPYRHTWEWDGVRWELRQPNNAPAARGGAAMAYDPASGETLLFGGSSLFSQVFRDTWAWNGIDWRQLTPAAAPSARENHRMVYDARRGRMVLFGGEHQFVPLGDTWEWDGSTWIHRNVPGPSPRSDYGLAYDAGRGVTVLYGGSNLFQSLSDTWEWDGVQWTQRSPTNVPPPGFDVGMAYDAARGRVVLSTDTLLTRTWEWDGHDWHPSPAPKVITGPAVYASGAGHVVMFAGHETVVYTDQPAQVSMRGTPCGVGAVPRLSAFGRPARGRDSYGLDLSGAGNGALGVVMLAARAASVPLGGCTLHLDPATIVVSVPVVCNAGGFAHLPLPIPAGGGLHGASFEAQAGVLEAGGPAFGLALSGALRTTLGE